jgi:hypothetical protein
MSGKENVKLQNAKDEHRGRKFEFSSGLSKQVNARYVVDVAKLWQWDGIAAVEAKSRGKIQFSLANEGRSSMLNHRHERSLV